MGSRMGSQSFNANRRGRPNVSIGPLSKDYYSEVGEEEEEEEEDRCGICSALASNCATLDCCSHVFCFSCIDNWSSVSNFCPLCKLQFRFISCLSGCREDDIDNTLPFTFPSFFIDEDAVACLEGASCLIRAGVPMEHEDAADTSVACDSCDHWYHAGCVGFDPTVSWGSWLCPRCVERTALQQRPATPFRAATSIPLTTVVTSFSPGPVPVAELAYSAPVVSERDPSLAISVADEGESAVVLSMHNLPELSKVASCPEVASLQSRQPMIPMSCTVLLPLLVESIQEYSSMSADSTIPRDLTVNRFAKAPMILTSTIKTEARKSGHSDGGLSQDASRLPQFGNGQTSNSEARDGDIFPSSVSFTDVAEERQAGIKRKGKSKLSRQDGDTIHADDLPEPPRKVARNAVKKKDVLPGASDQAGTHNLLKDIPPSQEKSSKTERAGSLSAVCEDNELKVPYTEVGAVEDLIDLVKEDNKPILLKTGNGGSNPTKGVRTRIVMWRGTDGRAAQLVEDIRQQMRSAAGYGASEDLGKVEVSDDRFFAAFKAALTRTSSQTLDVKSRASKQRRRLWLAKVLDQVPSGKGHRVRESLTKKLYAGGGGSRKTWDRDWDISFWKEQSARLKKARKEATDTLEGRGKNGRAREVKATSSAVKEDEAILGFSTTDTDTDDSVLTRLYVADTSLFARDNDIKPVCLHSSTKEKVLGQRDGTIGIGLEACLGQLSFPSLQGPSKPRKKETGFTKEAQKSERQDTPQGAAGQVEASGKTKRVLSTKDAQCSPSQSEKKDKRQWALELLARKSGDAMTSSSPPKNVASTKESLLLQLPEELRPTLPTDRHSRVPTAVRQLQLNRILEQYLQKAKLSSLQGGFRCKSVIAAAVAKELEIFENSNSRGVYTNLCVRALAQKDPVKLQVTIPSPPRPGVNDDVTEALRATGLISDSPPQSPCASQSTSLGCQSTGFNPAADKISAVKQPTFDSVVSSRLVIGTSGPSDTIPVMPQVDRLEPDNVLELATQSSEDLVADFGADCGELELPDQLHGCIPSRLNGVASSSQLPESASRTMRVVLTTGKKLSLSEAPGDGERILQGAETRTDGNKDLVISSGESMYIRESSLTQSQSEERQNAQSVVKVVGKTGTVETSDSVTALDVGLDGCKDSGRLSRDAKAEEEEAKTSTEGCGPAGESEGDDWLKTGKFPDLENRIEKMRNNVSQMNPIFLSQFTEYGEANVFGGFIEKGTLPAEPRQHDGATAVSLSADDGVNEEKIKTATVDGPQTEAMVASIRKKVQMYVKEHLRPLFKSGVIEAEQFQWAVSKTSAKVMQHHGDARSADFLIVEGSKVKKLADQYLQAYTHRK
ncbi:unnamed protein product [Sphagnum jensenii]|uniref:RING-type domain-containing protein n=1 Tax=Sphagnum jensenii TaxID=128206 RepID=A0ABP1AM41_9BRYO